MKELTDEEKIARYEARKEADREAAKRYYWAHRDERVAYQRSVSKEVTRQRNKDSRAKLKAEVYSHYGNACACCGETEPLFLTIEHLNGGGFQHRKSVGGGLAMLYDIRNRGFPPEFAILCNNCNHGKHLNGGICPHEE